MDNYVSGKMKSVGTYSPCDLCSANTLSSESAINTASAALIPTFSVASFVPVDDFLLFLISKHSERQERVCRKCIYLLRVVPRMGVFL